jgi:CheY-like chemotaxis protein
MEADGCRILLVEDDDADAFFFRRALDKAGFPGELIWKASPTEAWLALKEMEQPERLHLILCDGMWAEDGAHDLLQWMRVHPVFGKVPFVVYSGALPPQRAAQMRHLGADLVLEKAGITEMSERLRPAFLLLPPACRAWLK